MLKLIDKLKQNRILTKDEFITLLDQHTEKDAEYLFSIARAIREEVYGKDVYLRGLMNSPTTVRTIAITVVFVEVTKTPIDTA